MAVPNRVYAATASKGVYRCGAFTSSGDQPVWAAYNTGLAATTPTAFCLDRSASPSDARMFCIQGGDLYRRVTGGDWTVVLTAAAAIALTQAGQQMMSVITDPVTGYVYVPTYGKPGEIDWSSVYLLRSIDHGDNWTATTIATNLIAVYNMSNVDAYDSAVAFAHVRAIATSERVCYSVNDGTSWTEVGVSATGALPGDHVRVHPASGIIYGTSWDDNYDVFRLNPTTGAVTYPAGGNGAGPYGGSLWCDPDDADHAATFYGNFRETADDWATLVTDQDMDDNYKEIARGCETDCWVHGRVNNGAAVAVSTNGYTLSHRSGANYASSPYADSIPTDCGGIIECGLWTVFDPPSAGPTPPGAVITVDGTPITLVGPGLYQAVSMPGHTGIDRAQAMPGDRAAFDVDNYPTEHASDLHKDTPTHHNPWPMAPGEAAVSDGAKVVPTVVATAEDLDDAIDTHNADPDAHPDLVLHEHIYQEDHSATCDGAETEFATSHTYVTGTTRVWLNGLLQRPGEGHDYTEDGTLDGITFAEAPYSGDVLIVAYILGSGVVVSGPYTTLVGTETPYLVAIHTHTTESDGSLSPAALMAAYEAYGFDAVAITDHDVITADPGGHSMLYIPGSEESPSSGHMGSLFGTYTGSDDGQDLIDGILAAGGIAILNHPNWSDHFPPAEMALLTDYLGIEIHNTLVLTSPGFAVNDWDYLLTNVRRGIWGFSADDYHTTTAVVRPGVGRIRVFASELTLTALKAALVAGDFVADVSNDGVTPGIPTITETGVTVECPGATAIRFIGDDGALLEEDAGDTGEYTFAGTETYVRIEAVGDYTEDFADALGDEWYESGGSWSVGAGILSQATAATGPYVKLLRRQIQGDQEILCDIYVGSNGGQAGVIFNATSTTSFYYLQLEDGAKARLWYNTASTLATGTTDIADGTWYSVRIQYTYATGAIKARVWATAGAEPETWEIDTTHTTHKQGMVGLRCRYLADFDNLYINGFKTYYQPIPVGDWE